MASPSELSTLVVIPGEPGKPDLNAIYGIAIAYAHSGLIVSDYGNKAGRPEFLFPAIVCSSFALELFLKFFISVELVENNQSQTKSLKDHKISSLWDKISKERQELIIGMFRNKSGKPVLNGIEIRKKIFMEVLKELGTAPFVDWRYIHELETIAFMSHAPIREVLEALVHAANYIMDEKDAFVEQSQ